MASVKAMMNCIGVGTSGTTSVLFHLFGFFRARVPDDPDPTVTAQVSLIDHVNSLRGHHIHLNIIRIGIDNYTPAEIDNIDYAIYRARNIYRAANMGIGRIEHYDVATANANGRDDIGSPDESEDLTHEWSVPNDGMDVFMVDNISADFVGRSPEDGGPCDKDDKDMNGVLGGEVNRPPEALARTFAHEIGHYLSLPHNHGDDCPTSTADRDNLMAQSRCANNARTSVSLTNSQIGLIHGHCFVHIGCML